MENNYIGNIPFLENEIKGYKYFSFEGEEKEYIDNLTRINIFVGPNNSGKSRFIRSIIMRDCISFLPKLSKYTNISIFKTYNSKISNIKSMFEHILNNFKNIDSSTKLKLETLKNNLKEIRYDKTNNDYFNDYLNIKDRLNQLDFSLFINSDSAQRFRENLDENMKNLNEIYSRIHKDIKTFDFKYYYIPVLRDLRFISKIEIESENDTFKNRILTDHDNTNENLNIFTGQTLYKDIDKMLRGEDLQRERLKKFESYLSKNYFENQSIELNPKRDSDVLYIKIGEEEQRPIYDLGDGIQSIILLSFPIFKHEDDNLIMAIEEPELYLHPYLQRKFIEVLSKPEKDNNHQYFIATHSNHLLDLTFDHDDISIYTFIKSKIGGFIIRNVENKEFNILKILGVRNSSVFLTNCTIWVEGITDRRYFRHYLNLYQEMLSEKVEIEMKFEEDKHFSFVEYSGNNIAHWSFLDPDGPKVEHLCGKLLLIADKDSSKFERHKKLKDKLDDKFIILKSREVENLISKEVLTKVICKLEKSDDYDSIKKCEIRRSEYKNEYLGKYIELSLLTNPNYKYFNIKGSGTIRDKNKFCDLVIEFTKKIDDLSNEAKDISKKIYDFIKKNDE